MNKKKQKHYGSGKNWHKKKKKIQKTNYLKILIKNIKQYKSSQNDNSSKQGYL